MSSWTDAAAAAPDLAARVQARFTAYKHHTMATLRADGSPRISGTEVMFVDGELWLGSMWQARKALDLQRDGRLALHSSTADETLADGDARIGGTAVEITDPDVIARVFAAVPELPPGPAHLFRVEVDELVVSQVAGDKMVITSWTPARGVRLVERT